MRKRLLALLAVSLGFLYAADIDLSSINSLIKDLEEATDADDEAVPTIGTLISDEDDDGETGVSEEIEVVEDEPTEESEEPQEEVEIEMAQEPQEEDDSEGPAWSSGDTIDQEMVEEEVEEGEEQLDDELELYDKALGEELQKLEELAQQKEHEMEEPEEEEEVEDDAIVTFAVPEKEKREEQATPILMADELSFDIAQKKEDVVTLVKMAIQEMKDKPLDVACNRFSHTKEFRKGDLYIFVYDINGTCIAHGDDDHLIWKNLYDLQDWVGTYIIQDIIKTAKAGGGWVTYGWHNATKIAYVEQIDKDGKPYIVGSGYYPHSKEEAVVNLVKGGVALFNKTKAEGQPADWAFGRLSYPSGAFVAGNLYLYALDFRGTIKAQGERPGLINSNAWNYKDANGKYVNREIIKKLKTSTKGVWVDYVSKRAPKRAYAEKVKGKDGRHYFIACGYYPDADRERTIDLVRKGYQFMKTHGKSNSVDSFSSRRDDDFRYGDLVLVVYDMKGKVIADGGNADNIGRNMIEVQDEDGVPYIKQMLKKVTKQGIWVNAKIKGSFQSTFAQKIDLGVGQYVITSSYYPVSKSETMILLVQSASSFLQANRREVAFGEFVKTSGKFRRGDLELVVIDTSGLCYVYGNDYDVIWRNIFDIKDEKGKQFIKAFINESQQGPVVVKTHMLNATKMNYVSSLEKDGKTYVVSSGFYQ